MIGLLNLHQITSSTFWTADRSLIVVAILLSLFGLIFSVFYNRKTLKLTKEHNEKTVEPHLDLSIVILEGAPHSIILKNSGFGPALVSKINYAFNGNSYFDFSKLIANHYPELSPFIITEKSSVRRVSSPTIIGATEELLLANTILKGNAPLGDYIEFLKEVDTEISFTTIYNVEKVMADKMIDQEN